MRAGLLARTMIEVNRMENIQTPSGFVKQEKRVLFRTRARLIKQSGFEKDLKEELFDSVKLTFQIRWVPDIKDTDTVTYDGQEFRISFIKNNVFDRTIDLDCVKINK